jgi:hypothetical protein
MGAMAWVVGRRNVPQGLRALAVVLLAGAELWALWWAFLVFYVAGDGGC